MNFRTIVNTPDIPLKITHNDSIFMMGSCFTDNIALKLLRNKFNVLYNPFGIIYNPYSISKLFDRIINLDFPQENEYIKNGELWHHFDFHSEMSGLYKKEVIEKANILIKTTNNYLTNSKIIIITLGTSKIHNLLSNNSIVANNHKFPSSHFTKSKLNINQVVEALQRTINSIKSINPSTKFIFTVSPVRHIKDGIVENQRSKATLILAIEKLVNNTDSFYFPSYEIVQDDLRDYRFYKDDLVHPSKFAIDYIWEKFSDTFFDTNTKQLNIQIEKINKSLEHKPFNPDSEEYKSFLLKLNTKISELEKINPAINFKSLL